MKLTQSTPVGEVEAKAATLSSDENYEDAAYYAQVAGAMRVFGLNAAEAHYYVSGEPIEVARKSAREEEAFVRDARIALRPTHPA